MTYDLDEACEILTRTPVLLEAQLSGLSTSWTMQNEGGNTWSPYDIVGHFIHGEKTDWIPRLEIILSNSEDKTFVPFDRFAQENDSTGKSIEQLLKKFKTLRFKNVAILR